MCEENGHKYSEICWIYYSTTITNSKLGVVGRVGKVLIISAIETDFFFKCNISWGLENNYKLHFITCKHVDFVICLDEF